MSDKSIRQQVEDGVQNGLSRALGSEGTDTGSADDALVEEIAAGRVPASAYPGDAETLEAAIQDHEGLSAEDELVAAEAVRNADASNYGLGVAGESDEIDTTPANATEAVALADDTSTATGSADADEYDAGVFVGGGRVDA